MHSCSSASEGWKSFSPIWEIPADMFNIFFFLSQFSNSFPLLQGPLLQASGIMGVSGFKLCRVIHSVPVSVLWLSCCMDIMTLMRLSIPSFQMNEWVKDRSAPLWDTHVHYRLAPLPGLISILTDGSLQNTETNRILSLFFSLRSFLLSSSWDCNLLEWRLFRKAEWNSSVWWILFPIVWYYALVKAFYLYECTWRFIQILWTYEKCIFSVQRMKNSLY